MFRKGISLCFILALFSNLKSQNTNAICGACGDFDLFKITFNENIKTLSAKADSFNTVFVNDACEEKNEDELTKKDQVCGFKYNIYTKETEKPFLSVSGKVKFDNLYLLTNVEKALVAYAATSYFIGEEKDFQILIDAVSKKFNAKPERKTLFLDGSLVYQWNTPAYIAQVSRSKEKLQREVSINGKTKMENYYYTTLSIYQNNRLDPKIKEIIRHNENFVIYKDSDFAK